ncbi:HAMP domain-containing histidine kinase [Prolixibacteraceae bacterium JC049]|nr:HAMP domain-containing histidine kinase [Prolixibacteraceae bacterium JC049]
MRLKFITYLSFFALIALVVVQVYIVNEFIQLKNNEFDKKYGEEVFTALDLVKNDFNYDPLDSALTYLDRFADKLMDNQSDFDIIQEDARIKRKIAEEFETIIGEQEKITPFLKEYLPQRGLDNDFITRFNVRELKLIYYGRSYMIISDENEATAEAVEKRESKDFIFVRSNAVGLNNCEFKLDFYIDFNHKKQIVIKEMRWILALMIITMLVVAVAFLLTVRNMFRHKKLSDIKSDFISNMTHELKTPLSTIAVASSSLTMEPVLKDKNKSKQLSEIIKKQNKHLTQMIDHILDVSVLERNEFKIALAEAPVRSFFEEIVSSFKIDIGKDKVQIHQNFSIAEDMVAEFDRFQLTRVMNNLLTNAVKYCDEEPQIELDVFSSSNYLHVNLKDNGIGIKKEDQRQIFTKFYRCNHNHKHKVKGLGLGLYFVKRIIDAHQGTIQVESSLTGGSTFKITLPLKHK